MAKHGKRLRKTYEAIDRETGYGIAEAVRIIKDSATSKFDETVEVAINLYVDPKHADQMVRGAVSLPHGTGKALKVAVFAKGDKAKEAEAAGADFVGAEDLAEKIQNGETGFDRCIATPDMMAVVGKLGKILGPKGLMPNPKLGTVTQDVTNAIKAAKAGQIQFCVEKKRHRPCRRRQGQLFGRSIGGKRRRVRRHHRQGETERRQRHVFKARQLDLDHGAGDQA